MSTTFRSAKSSRRRFLKQAALSIAMPAIIGRAGVSTAKAAFEGEGLIAVSWSGNYEQVFRETVIDPFNAKYNTKAETVGGWDQIVSQIKAAPEDNPPFDVTVAEEYISSAGLAENLYMKTDRSKIPNLEAVYPWFYETRPDKAKEYGIPFGGGTCMLLIRKKLGISAGFLGSVVGREACRKGHLRQRRLVVDTLCARRDESSVTWPRRDV